MANHLTTTAQSCLHPKPNLGRFLKFAAYSSPPEPMKVNAPNPRLLGEEVPARNTSMIQSNLTTSHRKKYLSLGTGEVG